MIKKENCYVQFLATPELKELLNRFSRLTGYSISYICSQLISSALSLEVDKINNRRFANEKTTTL